jgi:hypothetical protein
MTDAEIQTLAKLTASVAELTAAVYSLQSSLNKGGRGDVIGQVFEERAFHQRMKAVVNSLNGILIPKPESAHENP